MTYDQLVYALGFSVIFITGLYFVLTSICCGILTVIEASEKEDKDERKIKFMTGFLLIASVTLNVVMYVLIAKGVK